MQSVQEIDDIVNDESRNLDNVLIFGDDDNDGDRVNISDQVNVASNCEYFTESEYIDYLKTEKTSDDSHFKIVSLNIANILSKLAQFRIMIQNLSNNSNKPNIIAITETHLNDKQNHGYTKDEIQNLLPGYKFFHLNRKTKKGGGVGIFIDIKYAGNAKLESTNLFIDEIFEAITIRIPNITFETTKKDLVILTVYRQPGNANTTVFLESLQGWLDLYNKNTNEIVIMGDMNLDLLKYQTHNPTSDYIDIMMSHSFLPLITRPTRIKHSSATLIDHIFFKSTCFKAGILNSEIAGSHGFTDHLPTFCILKIRQTTKKPASTYTKTFFTSEGHDQRRENLKKVNWDLFYSENDPNNAYKMFQDQYCEIYNSSLTTKTYQVTWRNCPREPWMKPAIIRKMKKRDRLLKISGRRADYKKLRNEIVHDCRKAEREYFKKRITESWNNIREQWKTLRLVMGKTNDKTEFPSAFQHDGAWLTDKQHIVNGMNEYYSNVGPQVNKSVGTAKNGHRFYLSKNKARITQQLMECEFTADDVYNACKLLYPKSSCDAYGLSQKVILQDMDIITPLFVHLINCSIASGICPDMSKLAKVIPVYKNKGENYVFSNYRPISMLPVFSKIIEKLIYNKIFSFLVRYDILYKSQYGFRKGHNTTQATLDFLQTIEKAMKENELAIGIFCDLSKAFDTLDHEILLSKLDHYGIRGSWLKWLKSYLSNRQQFVEMDGKQSHLLPITVGVPQGSILGPLLFLIYINDLPAAVSDLTPIMFADDTNLVIKGKDLPELIKTINNELKHLSDYFKANKLKLNADKTKLVCFRKKGVKLTKDLIDIKLDGTKLQCESSATFLGITLDEHLTWENHCNLVANKMSRNTGVLNRVKKILPSSSLLTIYNSLIASHLYYGLEIWGAASGKFVNRISGIQKKAVRIITRAHRLAHTEPRMKSLNILKVADQHKLQCLCLTYDMMKKNCPDIYNFNLNRYAYSANRELRSTASQPDNIREPSLSSPWGKNSFPHLAPSYWNGIPEHVKQLMSRKAFKRATKKSLLESYVEKCNCENPLCADTRYHH